MLALLESMSPMELADDLGVTRKLIYRIRNGYAFRWSFPMQKALERRVDPNTLDMIQRVNWSTLSKTGTGRSTP